MEAHRKWPEWGPDCSCTHARVFTATRDVNCVMGRGVAMSLTKSMRRQTRLSSIHIDVAMSQDNNGFTSHASWFQIYKLPCRLQTRASCEVRMQECGLKSWNVIDRVGDGDWGGLSSVVLLDPIEGDRRGRGSSSKLFKQWNFWERTFLLSALKYDGLNNYNNVHVLADEELSSLRHTASTRLWSVTTFRP